MKTLPVEKLIVAVVVMASHHFALAQAVAPVVTPQAPQDWAQMQKYKAADEEILRTGEKIDSIFIGDSITESWLLRDNQFFVPGRLDRGISGQTTTQIMFRFQQDVLDLHPNIVHIMAGTNDVAQNMGFIPIDQIARNIETMAELARSNHIKVIIGSVLPCSDFFWHHGLQPATKIKALDKLLRDYAKKENFAFADYATAMDDGNGGLRTDFGINIRPDGQIDHVHPSANGYAVMDPIAEKVLRDLAAQH